jgi:CRISPR/Cas system-associated exonuclease Cas4 (RecB family)
MNAKSEIGWTSFRTYEKCGQKFLWRYGWEGIDLGGGPGKGKPFPPAPPRSMHDAVMGTVLARAMEKLYNQELWRDPKNLTKNLVDFTEREWKRLVANKKRNFIDYDEAQMSEEEMLEVCREGVAGFVKTMKTHRLLGKYSKAEVPLGGWINKWTYVNGDADLIVRRDDNGITIVDGKNTKHKMRYTDPDQLRWYAMLFMLAYGVMPDRLGFVWFRFPEEIEWVPCTKEDLQGLAHRAVEARNGMRKKKFEPEPTPDNCFGCNFEDVCDARQAQIKKNGGKRSLRRQPEELKEASGFVDLEL